MKVKECLDSNKQVLATCTPDEPVLTISERLNTLNIGAMPVCGADSKLAGVISERDVVRGFARNGAKLTERYVRDLMTREVITCPPDAAMAEAEALMNAHRIRHLPIVDGGKLVGMLSIRDIMVWRLKEKQQEANVLRDAVIAARYR
ncbi:MAG: CBS domain-containing protein [Roseiarcus sp.]